MVVNRDEHKNPVIRAFVALPVETLVEETARFLPGSGIFVFPFQESQIATNNMDDDHPSQEGSLDFLKPYEVDGEMFALSSGEQVSIRKYFLTFAPWKGAPIPNTYNNKPVIDWNGEPVFAELAVLRLFQSHGWEGVWVDSYRRKYRVGLPDVAEPVDIPEKQRQLIDSIRAKTSRSGGCWDVFVWEGDAVLFVELKRQKKDRIQDSQKVWLEKCLKLGLTAESFLFFEWVTYK